MEGRVEKKSSARETAEGSHFPCSMSAVLIAEVRDWGGPDAVAELLRRAGVERGIDYLTDLSNWISYGEAVRLWRAGVEVTHNPNFPRQVGHRAAERLASSSVATMLRSLGSPAALYQQIATSASKFSTVVRMEAVEVGEYTAVLTAEPVAGFSRSPDHCAWTTGLLAAGPILYGLDYATVEHLECAACGAPKCVYRISWRDQRRDPGSEGQEVAVLRQQLEGLQERFKGLFAAASDLIAADDISDILGRLANRAALEVRAPRYVLAAQLSPNGEVHCHQRGFAPAELRAHVDRLLDPSDQEFPKSWLVVPVRSDRRNYGRLVAAFESDTSFFPQERELLEIFARYAASALDGAAALAAAQRQYDQTSALLKLARALASAGTSHEVAQRLAEALPLVVDADRVSVFLWDAGSQQLVRVAMTSNDPDDPQLDASWSKTPTRGGPIDELLANPRREAVFLDAESGDPLMRQEMLAVGNVAAIVVPIVVPDAFLGLLSVSVRRDPARLAPMPDLIDRLSGVAAQATTALQNGQLVDHITHQAMHDQLTGLANRAQFMEELRKAISRARRSGEMVSVLFLDLDRFKPVNDEFGHDVGDRLLSAVAERLTGCTRSGDVVARLGGDEFAVLVAGHRTPDEGERLSTRLHQAFCDPFQIDRHVLPLTASVGQAVYPSDADSAETLLRHADLSMFQHKRRGTTSQPRPPRPGGVGSADVDPAPADPHP
jgi:diguanylate cyclase (GGDEF)-like protein